MSTSPAPVEVLHADGQLADPDVWFPDTDPDTLTEEPFLVVAITGSQASGKSTLVNAIFSTTFPVADSLSSGLAAAPAVYAQRAPANPDLQLLRNTLVFDLEGADARSRGRDAKIFTAQSTSFVAAMADVVIVNLWFHDACRYDSTAYALIRSILNTSAQSLVDGASYRSALVLTVRDAEQDSDDSNSALHDLIAQDVSCRKSFSLIIYSIN